MGANVDVEESAVANPLTNNHNDSEDTIPNELDRPTEEKPSDESYDTGLTAWLQVLGSFFLFFNSWYVHHPPPRSWL